MADAALRVCVAYSPAPREVREWDVALARGATVADALAASGLAAEYPAWDREGASLAVWGRKALAGQALRDRDRVEVLRPLKVDPKVARRERFRRQGARAAGLFARKKP